MRIGVVAPACALAPDVPERICALAADRFGPDAPDIIFHPQCFLSDGHFAGPDGARADALVDYANDPGLDAIWFARGGYGSNRIVGDVLGSLGPGAQNKIFAGYSDMGFLLAGLAARRIGLPVHGPMPSDIRREGGEAAISRILDWFVRRDTAGCEPTSIDHSCLAFNITILSSIIGTPLQPDMAGKVLMLEEIDEQMYRIDRALFHITSNENVRKVAGIMLGRCSQIPENDPDFRQDEEQIMTHWCQVSGISYLGRADIGHDVNNKIVPF